MTGDVLDKFSGLISTALGLVAALAWNTATQNLFSATFGDTSDALMGQFAYAILITVVVILATIAGRPRGRRSWRRNGIRACLAD